MLEIRECDVLDSLWNNIHNLILWLNEIQELTIKIPLDNLCSCALYDKRNLHYLVSCCKVIHFGNISLICELEIHNLIGNGHCCCSKASLSCYTDDDCIRSFAKILVYIEANIISMSCNLWHYLLCCIAKECVCDNHIFSCGCALLILDVKGKIKVVASCTHIHRIVCWCCKGYLCSIIKRSIKSTNNQRCLRWVKQE